jgi:hypothetical protein
MECKDWPNLADGEPGSFRKQIEALLWKETRTRGGGRNKSQGGIQQQDVFRNDSPIKWSMSQPLMATVKTQHVREGKWRETTRMMVLQQGQTDWRLLKVDHMKFKTTQKHRSTITMKEYPQVGKTGVDAVHEKAAHRRSIS